MAYNLNYNPGTEHDKNIRHRKYLKIFVITLVVLALVVLIVVGIKNWMEQKEARKIETNDIRLTAEEEKVLIENMTATTTSTSSLSNKERDDLIKAMTPKSPKSSSPSSQ